MRVKIRPATAADACPMLALERASPTSAHWSEEQYLALFQPGGDGPERLVLVAESPTVTSDAAACNLAGFLVARHVGSEWELENIVVALSARRRGIGRQLLESLLITVRKTGGDSVFLEVRESNVAARSFYEKLSFRQTGRRAAYYPNLSGGNASEDAILYRIDV